MAGLVGVTPPQVQVPQQGVPDAVSEVVVIERFAVPIAEDILREVSGRPIMRLEGIADGCETSMSRADS